MWISNTAIENDRKPNLSIKDREIISDELLDEKIIVGTRIDDATGEVVEVSKTAREIFEDEAKNTTFMNRLKDCV